MNWQKQDPSDIGDILQHANGRLLFRIKDIREDQTDFRYHGFNLQHYPNCYRSYEVEGTSGKSLVAYIGKTWNKNTNGVVYKSGITNDCPNIGLNKLF